MKIFKYMRDFGICGPRSNSTSTSIISDAWALNYNHSTSIAASCNTSPSCQVQSLSHGDWLRPHLIFAGWNAQRGPPSYKCAYTSAPIERHHVIVLLRESIFYFFCGWNSTLLRPTKQAALEEMEQRHQFLVMRKDLEEGSQDLM